MFGDEQVMWVENANVFSIYVTRFIRYKLNENGTCKHRIGLCKSCKLGLKYVVSRKDVNFIHSISTPPDGRVTSITCSTGSATLLDE